MTCVYLLHLSEPIAHSQHYIGWAKDFDNRLDHHKNGTGARFTQVAVERGIEIQVARVWEGKDKSFERHLKNQKNGRCMCPICNPGNARMMEDNHV